MCTVRSSFSPLNRACLIAYVSCCIGTNLFQLAAGTLPTAERLAVERHLASCADCRRECDNWLALGDAICESEQELPTDSGFTTGLARLRTALTLMYDDDFEHPEGESSSMEPDSQPNDTYAPAGLHDDERPTTTSISRACPYPAIAATVAIVLLMALVFGVFATQPRPGADFGMGGSSTQTPMQMPTQTPMPTLAIGGAGQTVPEGVSAVSISMVSASDGWAVATLPNNIGATLLRYANGHWSLSGDSFAGIYFTDISMDSHDDGWAVGAYNDQTTGVVLHYSGAAGAKSRCHRSSSPGRVCGHTRHHMY